MTPTKISAVLLDLDGTLVDTLPALRDAYAQFMAAHGLPSSDAEFERWNGPPLREAVSGLASAHTIPGPPEGLLAQYMSIVDRCYVSGAKLAPDAIELLDAIQAMGAVAAVVTSAPGPLAERVLGHLGVRDRIRAVIGCDAVARGKPAPDLYESALARLEIAAESAVAIEDSAPGVSAACGAGVKCIGVGGGPQQRLLRAGAIASVAGLREALDVIAAVANGASRITPATGGLSVVVVENDVAYSAPVVEAIEERWAAALARQPSLRDGEIVATLEMSRDAADRLRIQAEVTRYRRFVAQRAGVPLGIRALAVSGVTRLADGRVVLGKRSPDVTQSPGCWELTPSGGIDRKWVVGGGVDPSMALREELEEELGVTSDAVRAVRFLGALEDLDDRVIDLCYAIDTDADESAIQGGIRRTGEYRAVQFVEPARVLEVLAAQGDGVVPTVEPLLALLRSP